MLLCGKTEAQTPEILEAKNALLEYSKEDTTKLELLHKYLFSIYETDVETADSLIIVSEQLARKINYEELVAKVLFVKGEVKKEQHTYDKAIRYYSSALKIYDQENKKDSVALCYTEIAVANYYSRKFNKAVINFTEALNLYEKLDDKENQAIICNGLAVSYSEIGDSEKMFENYKKALAIFMLTNNEMGLMKCYNNLGVAYDDSGNYPVAMENYSRALEIAKKINNSSTAYKILNNIGLIHKHTGDFDKALTYYLEALALVKTLDIKKDIVKCLNNIGVIYLKKGEKNKAEENYLKALTIASAISDKQITSLSYNNLGGFYFNEKEYDLALDYYKKALILKKEVNDDFGLCHSNIGIAEVYVAEKKYSKAIGYAKEAQLIARENNFLSNESEIYKLLFQIYQGTKQYEKALFNHMQYKRISDSLLNKKSIQKITQLEYDYKYQAQLKSANDRELKLKERVVLSNQNLEKSKQNLLLFIILFLLLSIVLGGVIFYLRVKNIKEKTQNIVIEQKLLRSQMTPHFIFNSLSVLQAIILNKEEEKAVTYLSKFSRLLRIILENSREKSVSLDQEVHAIENYLYLQNMGIEHPYRYTLHVSKDIDPKLFNIPPMLIQPFVENAIEHAFENQEKDKCIDLKLTLKDGALICTILDNGMGIETDQKKYSNKQKHSLATTITTERLEMISKDFNMKGSVSVMDRKLYNDKGTVVTLVIPYKISQV